MTDQQQLSEEEIQDLRREMREDLERIQFELKKSDKNLGPTGPRTSEHTLSIDAHIKSLDQN